MTDAIQDRRTLVSLRIELAPFPEGNRELQFTFVDGDGASMPAALNARPGEFEYLHDVLSRIAAGTAEPVGELPFGQPDQPRVMVGFDGFQAPNFAFHCTVAYPAGDGNFLATTWAAPVSEASLARLVESLRTVSEAGSGVVEWKAAD